MDINKIEELIGVLEGSETEELSVRRGDVSVHIKKSPKPKPVAKPRTRAAKSEAASAAASSTEKTVLSPMVGIFHTVDTEVGVGSTIVQGQPVGAIESMKLLNEVDAEFGGVITELLVENGSPVEFGQPLFKIETA